MVYPAKTYELKVFPADSVEGGCKEELCAWLIEQGVDSYVEGAVDSLDLDPDYGSYGEDIYVELGGADAPLSIYKYDKDYLIGLRARLEAKFGQRVRCELDGIDTQGWMEGWKASFQPIETSQLFIYPPWFTGELPHPKLPLIIEPGMAFGTGQHATTRGCLEQLESLGKVNFEASLLDVGTGTGILALAAKKLGYKRVVGTDIDPDALLASQANAALNTLEIDLYQGSLPASPCSFDVVIANILARVLRQMMMDLAQATCAGGHLILSGLLTEDAHALIDQASKSDFILVSKLENDGWATLLMRKKP